MNRRELFQAPIKRIKENMSDTSEHESETTEKKLETPVISHNELMMALGSDFSTNQLSMEVMRMGIDPSNMSEADMMDLIIAKMEMARATSNPAITEEINTNNS